MKTPMVRLAYLNKPEVHILLLGSLAAVVHGVLLPVFGLVISSAIKAFNQPPDELSKDTSFWGLMCVVVGIISIIAIPAEYFLFGIAGGKLLERIRALSFQSIVHQEVAWFDDPKNSRLLAALLMQRNLFMVSVSDYKLPSLVTTNWPEQIINHG